MAYLKALPYLLLGLLLLGLVMLWLDRERISAELTKTQTQLDQASEAIRQNYLDRQLLKAEIVRRDRIVATTQAIRDRLERQLSEALEKLDKELADDECAQTDHPAAVSELLRQ